MASSSEPLVSIITPSFGQGGFIEATIESVKHQEYGRFEHIIVDAGSTDQTIDLLRRHEGTYPMRWSSEPDEGMYDGVNKGMQQARGDILTYLNSDDLYFPWTLRVVVDAFRRQPEVDVVFGDALGVREETGGEDLRFQPDLGYSFYLRSGSLVQPAVFWRRCVYDETGDFDTGYRLAGDLDYWLRMGPDRRRLRVDEVLAIERDHGEAKRFAGAAAISDESRRIRHAHDRAPAAIRRAGLVSGRFRAWWARRVLWLRLARASSSISGSVDGPWGNFLAASRLSLPMRKVLAVQIPWLGPRIASGSISTGVDWLHPTD